MVKGSQVFRILEIYSSFIKKTREEMDSHRNNNNNNNNILMDFLCKVKEGTFFSLLCAWTCFDFLRRRRRRKKSISVWLVTFTSRATGFLIKLAHFPLLLFLFMNRRTEEEEAKSLLYQERIENSLLGFLNYLKENLIFVCGRPENVVDRLQGRNWPVTDSTTAQTKDNFESSHSTK